MKKLYSIGFAILASGLLFSSDAQAQQLLSLVKTEAFNNYYYGGYYSENLGTTVTEQVYTYNDKNQMTDISTWITTKDERYLSNQSIYTYTEDGQTLSIITKQWDYTKKEMHVQGITDYSYNADGQIDWMMYQYRDYTSGELINSYKYEYTYGEGDSQEFKTYNWSVPDGDWVEQPPYDYTEEVEVLEEVVELDGRYSHGRSESEFFYNEDSTVSTSIYKNYHVKSDTWYNTSRTVSHLNEHGFSVKSVTENWNLYCETWSPSYMHHTKYNDNNVSIQSEYYSWDQMGKEWVMNSRTTSTYIDPKPQIDPIEVDAAWGLFPNPSDGEVFIELEEGNDQEYRIEVMNKLGQTVYADKIGPNSVEKTLDLDFLPNGNYIVRLDDGKSKSSRQLLIQQ